MSKNKYKTKIVLIDAHAILHRAYHALPDFSSREGEPTGALYGLSAMLLRLIDELKPDYIFACYDRPEPTFRKQIYEDYKSGRAKAEPELISQIIRSRDIFQAFQIPIYDQPGLEADDIIGTLTHILAEDKDNQVVIASGDMDTLQLVRDDQVLVFTLKKGLNDTITYNEKAVKDRYGFAPQFLIDYKGLRGDPSDNIIGVPGIGEKTATDLIKEFGTIENLYQAIKTDETQVLARGVKPRILEILRANEEEALFSKALATVRLDAQVDFVLPMETWQTTFDPVLVENIFLQLDFRSLVSRLKKVFSTAIKKGDEGADKNISSDEWRPLAIALWLINSDLTNPKVEDIWSYTGSQDYELSKKKLLADLDKLGLTKVYQEIELPLMPIIKQAEDKGFLIDKNKLALLSIDYHKKLETLEVKISSLAGEKINLNSPKQLGELLFGKMGLSTKGLKKTAGGNQSTRESELVKLREIHPIIDEILAYRELQKLVSTYLDALPKLLDKDDVLHTTLNQMGTTTGRMSSSNPNLQNIPSKGDQGSVIRQAFIARPGYKLLALDYSQIELRVLAILSQDEELIRIFQAGEDIHSAVASRVFGVTEKEVTKEMRRRAKVINFGIIYGMGINALKVNLGTTREEAQKFQDNYFATFPTIKQYFDLVIEGARKRGYTETLFGRRRYLPSLRSPLPQIRAGAERMAMNAPLQGTAADIIKLAMISVDKKLALVGLQGQVNLLLQVHDELIYEVESGVVEKTARLIKEEMEGVLDNKLPLVVSVSLGSSWGEMEKFA